MMERGLPCPICVTEDELAKYDSIERKTVSQIKDIVRGMIPKVDNQESRTQFEVEWEVNRRKTKPVLMTFYNSIAEYLSE